MWLKYLFYIIFLKGPKCLPDVHSNLEIIKGNHFNFDIWPLSVPPSMRDKAPELKHNLSSNNGKTLPVGGATAV